MIENVFDTKMRLKINIPKLNILLGFLLFLSPNILIAQNDSMYIMRYGSIIGKYF